MLRLIGVFSPMFVVVVGEGSMSDSKHFARFVTGSLTPKTFLLHVTNGRCAKRTAPPPSSKRVLSYTTAMINTFLVRTIIRTSCVLFLYFLLYVKYLYDYTYAKIFEYSTIAYFYAYFYFYSLRFVYAKVATIIFQNETFRSVY